jgi:hypothetical protein
MAFDKKPSKYPEYSDHGTIGSAEELDAYGVWVKSEPQDLTAGLAGAVNFDAEAVPYEADFDTEFPDLNLSNIGLADLEPQIPEISVDDDDNGGFDDGITAEREQVSEEASTQMLMKIADELSSIRAELNTLKKEFADIRAESASTIKTDVKAEPSHGGFFAEDDDEKIALTGAEMEDILTSADFAEEQDLSFDAAREADEAALKELSAQNESAVAEEAPEEISIDFANLGIDMDDNAEETPEELPPLEAADDVFETPSFDDEFSFDETPMLEPFDQPEEITQEEETLAPLEPLAPLDEDEVLRDIRLEGAIPLTPAPDNTGYLEEDPFAHEHSDLGATPPDAGALGEELPLEEPPLEDTALEDISLDAGALGEELSLEEPSFDDTALEDISFDAGALGGEPPLEEPPLEETVLEEAVPADTVLEEPVSEEAAPAEAAPADALADTPDIVFDDVGFDVGFDDFSVDDSPFGGETAEAPPPPDAGPVELSETVIDEPAPEPEADTAESPAPLELKEEAADEQSFDVGPLELSEMAIDEPVFETDTAESPAPLELEEAAPGEQGFDVDSMELSEAVIDEPDLSVGLVEPPLEEPVLDDISFKDDISLDMDDFESDIDVAADEPEPKSGKPGGHAEDHADSVDDSFAQVIPEGFEINAREAPISADDDLEALTDDLSIAGESPPDAEAKIAEPGAGEDIAIPSGLKSDLKNVLSYMDHLLESLPEEKIEEFAQSEYFDTYKKIFKELGLV